eukprot:Blabericola_migrator_1__1621@NODE_1434_length_4553_cov_5_965002_g953_i0_p4_GENE_NODE_1434_length_4553_cov_5_965002_g953_i0NODE_1434_length_4553_cov_5_965002_g953_i0_p4_ORF_typecomplete_len108_score1_41_NODE_1434_length_4553_cov_5_965002_g953_i034633786
MSRSYFCSFRPQRNRRPAVALCSHWRAERSVKTTTWEAQTMWSNRLKAQTAAHPSRSLVDQFFKHSLAKRWRIHSPRLGRRPALGSTNSQVTGVSEYTNLPLPAQPV